MFLDNAYRVTITRGMEQPPIEPAKMAHWIAIMSALDERVRVWVNARLAANDVDYIRAQIERFASVSIPDARASLSFQARIAGAI